MKERGIALSAPLVRATLEDRKEQTRRVARVQACNGKHAPEQRARCVPALLETGAWAWDFDTGGEIHGPEFRCPYGVVGDRLYVREPLRPGGGDPEVVTYDADGAHVVRHNDDVFAGSGVVTWPWKARYIASRYCPRWAARIFLELTDVRLERLQAISEEDAIAEGVRKLVGGHVWKEDPDPDDPLDWYFDASRAFAHGWDTINGARPGCSWKTNPWVWALTFRRVQP